MSEAVKFVVALLSSLFAAVTTCITLGIIVSSREQKRLEREHAEFEEHRQWQRQFDELWMNMVVRGHYSDDIVEDEGGYLAPPGTEEVLAQIADGTLASMAREVPRGALPDPTLWEVLERHSNRTTRWTFHDREEFEMYIRSLPNGVVHHASISAVRDPVWTFGNAYPEHIQQQIVATFELITSPEEAHIYGGTLLHTEECARRFGPAFGPQNTTSNIRLIDTTDEEFERLSRMREDLVRQMQEAERQGMMVGHYALPEIREMREARARQLAAGHEAGLISRDELRRELLGMDIDDFEGRLPVTSGSSFENAINMTASSCFAVIHEPRRGFRLSPEEEAEVRRNAHRHAEQYAERNQPTRQRVFPNRDREIAVRKAKDLLKAVLTEEEIQELEEFSTVTINTKAGLFRIRIDKQISLQAPTYNVTHKKYRWCLNLSQMVESVDDLPLQDYPTPDHYAAQVLLLRTDPERFMKVANKRAIDPTEDE